VAASLPRGELLPPGTDAVELSSVAWMSSLPSTAAHPCPRRSLPHFRRPALLAAVAMGAMAELPVSPAPRVRTPPPSALLPPSALVVGAREVFHGVASLFMAQKSSQPMPSPCCPWRLLFSPMADPLYYRSSSSSHQRRQQQHHA
jgi:hypothetical protein